MDLESASGVRFVTISEEQSGQRIDNYLITALKGVPKSRVYRLLRKGEVRVNKGRVKPEYKLQQGDMIRIPPVRVAEVAEAAQPRAYHLERLEQAIIYEDKKILVINKPSGLAVHGGSGVSLGLIEILRALRPDAPFLELVHRLDRETSGCLMIAKKRSALRQLHDMLRESDINKEYLALVKGQWHGGSRTVNAPLYKNQLQSGERVVKVSDQGKESISHFAPEICFNDCSLVRVTLETGRTHQIRVHSAHIGHPIAGDEKYGDESFNAVMKQRGLRRLFLHAERLSFVWPESGEPASFYAPLDDELQTIIDRVGGGQ